jgi:hypothetical protein
MEGHPGKEGEGRKMDKVIAARALRVLADRINSVRAPKKEAGV